jgi:hypothetical protein
MGIQYVSRNLRPYREKDRGQELNMVKLTFYTKDGCWLCDTAEEMINGYKQKYDIKVNKIAIDSDDELYEMYRFDIPVIEFNDGSTLNGRIKKKDFLNQLNANIE